MTEFRIWHASIDAYHTAFRLVQILTYANRSYSVGRLRILDMYRLYPPLLFRLRSTHSFRRALTEAGIRKPEQHFVRLPSMASVWQEIFPYQVAAVNHLVATGVLNRSKLQDGIASLDTDTIPNVLQDEIAKSLEKDAAILEILVAKLAEFGDEGSDSLSVRAHLPKIGSLV